MAHDANQDRIIELEKDSAVVKAEKAQQTIEILNESYKETTKETQDMLNKPLVTSEEMGEEDRDFLEMVVLMVRQKEIDLLSTGTLMNNPVYEKLEPKVKAKVEYDALNLLNTLRNIYKLYQAKQTDTYQFRSMLTQFRLTKERIEEEAGDVYII